MFFLKRFPQRFPKFTRIAFCEFTYALTFLNFEFLFCFLLYFIVTSACPGEVAACFIIFYSVEIISRGIKISSGRIAVYIKPFIVCFGVFYVAGLCLKSLAESIKGYVM